MNQGTSTNDILNEDDNTLPVAPSGLKVLTVLTIIGCILSGLLVASTSLIYDFSEKMMDKAVASGKEFSAKEVASMENAKAAIELGRHNLIPLMIIGLLGISLCFVGALMMRKLKKDGFWLYVVGELAPIIATFFIVGTAQFNGIFSVIIGLGIPVTFVLLYAAQRKHLIY